MIYDHLLTFLTLFSLQASFCMNSDIHIKNTKQYADFMLILEQCLMMKRKIPALF